MYYEQKFGKFSVKQLRRKNVELYRKARRKFVEASRQQNKYKSDDYTRFCCITQFVML